MYGIGMFSSMPISSQKRREARATTILLDQRDIAGFVLGAPIVGTGLGEDVAEDIGIAQVGVGGGEATTADPGNGGSGRIGGEVIAVARPERVPG
ncbi:MAG: hypothetical protein U0232_21785 [Thermomicrobiales bacterium]